MFNAFFMIIGKITCVIIALILAVVGMYHLDQRYSFSVAAQGIFEWLIALTIFCFIIFT